LNRPPVRRLFDLAFKIAITGLLVLVIVSVVTDAISHSLWPLLTVDSFTWRTKRHGAED
jgi:hypothetical protein